MGRREAGAQTGPKAEMVRKGKERRKRESVRRSICV